MPTNEVTAARDLPREAFRKENEEKVSHKEFWSKEASKHITPVYKASPEGFDPVLKIKKFLSDVEYKEVIDFGCGYGRLSNAFPSDRYNGVDFSEEMLTIARKNNPDKTYKEVDSESDLPFGDLFFAYTVLLHNPDEEVLNIIKRARSVGCNKFVVCEILGHEWRRAGVPPVYNRTRAEYVHLFASLGFHLHKCEVHPYKHYADDPKFADRNTDIVFMYFKRDVQISLLCPTRDRPAGCKALLKSIQKTLPRWKWNKNVEIIFWIDDDDPSREELCSFLDSQKSNLIRYIIGPRCFLSTAWNHLARASFGDLLFMMNDDIRMGSPLWDFCFMKWLDTFPDLLCMLFPNDGINGRKHAAFPLITRRWHDILGYFTSERFKSIYSDTWIFHIAVKCLRDKYCGDVKIQHLHPSVIPEAKDHVYEEMRSGGQNAIAKQMFESKECQEEMSGEALKIIKRFKTDRQSVKDRYAKTLPKELRKIFDGKRVALIGPGQGLMDQGRGAMIDKYDVVCRVNECFPFEWQADYGSKTDVIFHTLSEITLFNFEKSMKADPKRAKKVKAVICPQLASNGVEVKGENYLTLDLRKRPSFFSVPDAWWYSILRGCYGCVPNTGTAALAYLLMFEIEELYLDGFDFYVDGKDPRKVHYPDYVEWGGDKVKVTPAKLHDQNAQRAYIIDQLLSHPKIKPSDDVAAELECCKTDPIMEMARKKNENAFFTRLLGAREHKELLALKKSGEVSK